MTVEEKQQTLEKIFWDYNFSEEELKNLLQGKIARIGHLDKTKLYARMLTSLGWYSILNIVPPGALRELLSDSVLEQVYSKDLRKKYAAAKRILFQ